METAVHIRELHHIYPGGTEVHLSGQDFRVLAGERVAILGPNGSGKTTLLKHVIGLLPSDSCQHCRVLGLDPRKDFARLIRRIGVVFQNVDEQIIGPTVWDDVAFGPRNHDLPPSEVEARVREALSVVGISHLADRIPHYLSGGEKKKVALAGAIVMRPDLLILDEPFDGLDPRSKGDLINLLNRLNSTRSTALVVTTHDVNLVAAIADTVYIFSRQRILARATPLQTFADPELLAGANLEPPAVVQLLTLLKEAGIPVTPTADVAGAASQLLDLLRNSVQA